MQHTRKVVRLLFSKVLFEGDIGMISVRLSHDRWPFPSLPMPSQLIPPSILFHLHSLSFPSLPFPSFSFPSHLLSIPFFPPPFPIPSHSIPFLFPFHAIFLCPMSPREGIGRNGLRPSVCASICFLAPPLVGDIQLQIYLFCLGLLWVIVILFSDA